MSITLWIVGSLLAVVGGLWAHGNYMNCLMFEFEEFDLRNELDRNKDEEAQVAKERNIRNWYISRGLCVLGILILVVQIRGVL